MQKTVSLKRNHEFRRLYGRGKHAANAYFAVYILKNRQQKNRLGITVSVKVGNAVVRNRIRRRIKEIYRLHEIAIKSPYDVVIVARGKAAHSSYAALEKALLALFCSLSIHAPKKTEAAES